MIKMILLLLISVSAFASTLQEKRTFSVPTKQAGVELQDQRGFGDQESEIRMMNLMMVGGSGFEGMDMAEMKTASATPLTSHQHGSPASLEDSMVLIKSPPVAKVGANEYEFSIKDFKGNPKVEVYMTSMDMGTEVPKARKLKTGAYQVKVNFSMQGPWEIKISHPKGEKKIAVQVIK